MGKLTIDSLDLKGKRVLVRCDFNVPLNEDQTIRDDKRIKDAVPTMQKVLADGGKLILMSHFGRPKGKVVPEMSLKPVAERLKELLGKNVILAPDCIGSEVEKIVSEMNNGDVVLLENLRFRKEETDSNENFAFKLASLAEIFINDAFGIAHRAHASVSVITKYFKQAASGYLLEKEIKYIGGAMSNPQKPLAAILAGIKIDGKIDVLNKFIEIADKIFIAGGIANTMLKAQGFEIGNSIFEEDKIGTALEIIEKAKINNTKIFLPIDMLCGKEFKNDTETMYVDTDQQKPGWIAMGVGPKTVEQYKTELAECKTLLWNGPMSVFEFENFAKETFEIAKIAADYTQNNGLISIIGGGDTAAAVKQAGLAEKFSHVSTGGGAALEYMEGKHLPGIVTITEKGFDMNKKFLIAGNWKMNKNVQESIEFAQDLTKTMVNNANVEIMIAPTYTSLYPVYEVIKKSHIDLGSQDIFWEESGAFTGKISADMLKSTGVKYTIIGHSERRQYFGETDETVNKRTKVALKAGFVPVVCVGEVLEEREQGIEKEVVKRQIVEGLKDIKLDDFLHFVVAYEPVWAIGTGKTASPEQAQEMHAYIRSILKEIYSEVLAQSTRILYGGSLKPSNAQDLLSQTDIDGGLIGGAALKTDLFSEIAKIAQGINK
ncbi:MAG: triose-phosphate isomerase [Candidatus Delongbacteria bacterium]|jgi:triosephosphate isomerase|nr:triose-phosphate isomerase [Candidatus Delongbacteria bacterium]